MNLINYGETNKKIKGYVTNNMKESLVTDKEKEFAKLSLMFSRVFTTPGYLIELKKNYIDDRELHFCSVVDANKRKETSYISLCEDNKPLLLLSHSEVGSNDTKYVEESFAVYSKETKRLDSRINTSLMIIGNSAVLAVKLLDKNKYEYHRNDYKFYYDVDRLVAYQIGNDKFFNTEDYRLTLVISKIEELSDKISREIDGYLDINLDYVKEYKIKRKK